MIPTSVDGPDVVIEVAHAELVGDESLAPNVTRRRRSRKASWSMPSGDLYGKLERFRVRTALVRAEGYEDVPPVKIHGPDHVARLMNEMGPAELPTIVTVGLSGAIEVQFIHSVRATEPDYSYGPYVVKMALMTASQAVICVARSVDPAKAKVWKFLVEQATDCTGVELLDFLLEDDGKVGRLKD